jgi:myosin-1
MKIKNFLLLLTTNKGASDTERAALKLMEPERFQLLTKGNCCSVGGMNDAENFIGMKQSMSVIGISKVQQDYIFTVIAAILHLGNITFDLTKEKSALSPGDTAAATAAYLLK